MADVKIDLIDSVNIRYDEGCAHHGLGVWKQQQNILTNQCLQEAMHAVKQLYR